MDTRKSLAMEPRAVEGLVLSLQALLAGYMGKDERLDRSTWLLRTRMVQEEKAQYEAGRDNIGRD